MLILTKEEINNKIDCFRKLIGFYNTKIEFLQKLLLYFEKNGQTVDCIVLNFCVKGETEEIFSLNDQIQIQQKDSNFNDYIMKSSDYVESIHKLNMTKSSEISDSNGDKTVKTVDSLHSNILQETVLPLSEQLRNNISQKSFLSESVYPSFHSIFSNDSCPILLETKTEPTVTELMDNGNLSRVLNSVKSEKTLSNSVNSEFSKQITVKFIKPITNVDCRDQLNNSNIFLSNTSIDEMDQIHPAMTSESVNSTKETCKSIKLKQFKCEFCSSAFAQKGVLNRHKFLRHSPTVVKPHICPKCQKGFTLKHHLKNHLKCKSGCRFFS